MAVQLGSIVNTITRQHLFPAVVENFYTGNALFMLLRGKKKAWSTGRRLVIPTEIAGRNALGSYSGADAFDTTQEDVRAQFTIDPAQYYANVTITGIQAAANKGVDGVVDLITAEMASVGRALPDAMGDDLYGDGTGNSNKALTGLVAHVDDTTSVTVYQNLSRSTYATLNSTRTAQSGALTVANVAADYDAAQVGSDSPNLFVTTPAVFTIFEALLTGTIQHNQGMNARYRLTPAGLQSGAITGNTGFTALAFRGVPFISDDKCTANNLWTLNTNYLDLYELEPDGAFVDGSKEGFGFTGWKKSINQDAIVGQLLWYGQLVGTQPRKQARRTGITS